VPLRGDAKAINVNWSMIEIVNHEGAVTYRDNFITDLPIRRDSVAALATAGRMCRRIENGTVNVLKTKGCNLERNFWDGQQNLSTLLATHNLLAFACHTACDLEDRA
jgi:hypothetical protein